MLKRYTNGEEKEHIVTNQLANMFHCPDCGFEYHAQHTEDDEEGGYTCPLCLVEQLKNRLNHFMNDAERKQEIIYKLQRLREQDKERIDTALYELDILHKKVNPSEHSSIDSHFKRIIDNLKNR